MRKEEKSNEGNVFDEALKQLVWAKFAYIFSDARKLSATGFAPFSYNHLGLEHHPEGLSLGSIFACLLRILRSEDSDSQVGMSTGNFYKDRQDPGLLQAVEFAIEVSLKDKGDPVELCRIDSKPYEVMVDTHQHVGSHKTSLCTKFGMHHTQVLVDHLIRSEEEKRRREAEAKKLRGRPPNGLTKLYYHYVQPFLPSQGTEEEIEEDKQVDSITDEELVNVLQKELAPDSFLATSLEDKFKYRHINDAHQDLECVYNIAACTEEKCIKVTFRGTVNLHNWIVNFQNDFVSRPNPITEHFEGKEEGVMLHEGWSAYLLRKRLDNQRSKYDEIADVVCELGSKEIGPGEFKLMVVGHSLGGALASIFGFYASADSRFTGGESRPPVDVYTFAAPWCGGMSYFRAFRHQEVTRRIRLVRFSHQHDIVPNSFWNMAYHPSGTCYLHTGVGVTLMHQHGHPPKIEYNHNYNSFWAMMWMRIRCWSLLKLIFFKIDYHVLPGLLMAMNEAIRVMKEQQMTFPTLQDLYNQHVYHTFPGEKEKAS
ncbi:Lipase class 3 family protein [Seminavis robusta]|uniref:Lipase class 3 family protein n=1 Tax=Seminavis robusta TaxID=568900 RepID=A0A9N8HHQ3_9STRA|nr:Lipase class 3 family protein [Seminavis robusta]|eukprot:Sro722_g192880.1 Lipase class 3 family protein (538) ;mRNA; f:25740-27460